MDKNPPNIPSLFAFLMKKPTSPEMSARHFFMPRRLFLTCACLFLLAGVVLGRDAVRWAEPEGFFERENIRRMQLAPGLVWIAASGERGGMPFETHILAVDLKPGARRLETWVGTQMEKRARPKEYVATFTPSRMLRESGALAAINASFFDIKATQVSFGLVVRNGWLLREPALKGYPTAVLSLADGRVMIGTPKWKGKIKAGNRELPLAGVNRPMLQEREAVLYCPPWKRTPDPAAPFLRGHGAIEIVMRRLVPAPVAQNGSARVTAKVLEVRAEPGRGPRELADDELAIVAGPQAAGFFRDLKEGSSLEIEWQLTDLPGDIRTDDVRHAVAGHAQLIAAGKLQDGNGAFWTVRHPRSAIGVDADGRRALLVLVDGRSPLSAGMDLTSLRDYLAYLGSHDAVNLDGGGSSAIAAWVAGPKNGEKTVRVLNRPSDRRERLIPSAIAVY